MKITKRQKLKAVELVNKEIGYGFSVRDSCAYVGISENRYYRWRKELASVYGMHSVYPQRFMDGYKGNRTDLATEELVIGWAQSKRFAHATEISKTVEEWNAIYVSPCLVRKILRGAGLYGRVTMRNQVTGATRTWTGIRPFAEKGEYLNPPLFPLNKAGTDNVLFFKCI